MCFVFFPQEWANGGGDADAGENVLSDESKSRMKEIESQNNRLKSQTEEWKRLYQDALKHCKDSHVSKNVPKKKLCGKKPVPSPDPFQPEKEK